MCNCLLHDISFDMAATVLIFTEELATEIFMQCNWSKNCAKNTENAWKMFAAYFWDSLGGGGGGGRKSMIVKRKILEEFFFLGGGGADL